MKVLVMECKSFKIDRDFEGNFFIISYSSIKMQLRLRKLYKNHNMNKNLFYDK